LRGFKEAFFSPFLEILKETFVGPLADFRCNNIRTASTYNKEHILCNNSQEKSQVDSPAIKK
jgi:hypothetical protein